MVVCIPFSTASSGWSPWRGTREVLIARMFGPCTVRIMKIENFVWACSRIGRVLPSGLAGRRGMAGGAAGGRGPRRGRSSSRTLVVGTSRHKVFIILYIATLLYQFLWCIEQNQSTSKIWVDMPDFEDNVRILRILPRHKNFSESKNLPKLRLQQNMRPILIFMDSLSI